MELSRDRKRGFSEKGKGGSGLVKKTKAAVTPIKASSRVLDRWKRLKA